MLKRKLEEWKERLGEKLPVTWIEKPLKYDYFSLSWEKLGLVLRYSNPRSALFAAEKVFQSLLLKKRMPSGEYPAQSHWRIFFPDSEVIEKIVGAGGNAVVLNEDQEAIADLAKSFKLKVFLKSKKVFDDLPFSSTYSSSVESFFGNIPKWADGLYWESPLFEKDCKTHLLETAKLKLELHLEEVKHIERSMPLFYVMKEGLSPNQLERFTAYIGPDTFLVGNDFGEKALPILSGLNQKAPLFLSETSSCLKNGAIIQLEGGWNNEGYLACHVEALGSALWGLQSLEESVWHWLILSYPEIDRHRDRELLMLFSRLGKHASYLQCRQQKRDAEDKFYIDTIKAEMALFEYQLSRWQKNLGVIRESKFLEEGNAFISFLRDLMKMAH